MAKCLNESNKNSNHVSLPNGNMNRIKQFTSSSSSLSSNMSSLSNNKFSTSSTIGSCNNKNDTLLDRKAFISLEKSINWQSLLINHSKSNNNQHSTAVANSENANFSQKQQYDHDAVINHHNGHHHHHQLQNGFINNQNFRNSTESSSFDSSTTEGASSEATEFSMPGMKYVPSWLKLLRLHKYSPIFAHMSYEEMMQLNEDDLERKNITKGARQKLYLSIQKLKARSAVLLASERELLCCRGVTGRGGAVYRKNISYSQLSQVLFQIRAFLSTPIRAHIKNFNDQTSAPPSPSPSSSSSSSSISIDPNLVLSFDITCSVDFNNNNNSATNTTGNILHQHSSSPSSSSSTSSPHHYYYDRGFLSSKNSDPKSQIIIDCWSILLSNNDLPTIIVRLIGHIVNILILKCRKHLKSLNIWQDYEELYGTLFDMNDEINKGRKINDRIDVDDNNDDDDEEYFSMATIQDHSPSLEDSDKENQDTDNLVGYGQKLPPVNSVNTRMTASTTKTTSSCCQTLGEQRNHLDDETCLNINGQNNEVTTTTTAMATATTATTCHAKLNIDKEELYPMMKKIIDKCILHEAFQPHQTLLMYWMRQLDYLFSSLKCSQSHFEVNNKINNDGHHKNISMDTNQAHQNDHHHHHHHHQHLQQLQQQHKTTKNNYLHSMPLSSAVTSNNGCGVDGTEFIGLLPSSSSFNNDNTEKLSSAYHRSVSPKLTTLSNNSHLGANYHHLQQQQQQQDSNISSSSWSHHHQFSNNQQVSGNNNRRSNNNLTPSTRRILSAANSINNNKSPMEKFNLRNHHNHHHRSKHRHRSASNGHQKFNPNIISNNTRSATSFGDPLTTSNFNSHHLSVISKISATKTMMADVYQQRNSSNVAVATDTLSSYNGSSSHPSSAFSARPIAEINLQNLLLQQLITAQQQQQQQQYQSFNTPSFQYNHQQTSLKYHHQNTKTPNFPSSLSTSLISSASSSSSSSTTSNNEICFRDCCPKSPTKLSLTVKRQSYNKMVTNDNVVVAPSINKLSDRETSISSSFDDLNSNVFDSVDNKTILPDEEKIDGNPLLLELIDWNSITTNTCFDNSKLPFESFLDDDYRFYFDDGFDSKIQTLFNGGIDLQPQQATVNNISNYTENHSTTTSVTFDDIEKLSIRIAEHALEING